MIAIRGAITIASDNAREVEEKSEYLIKEIISKNNLKINDIVSIITTCTSDIKSAYPGAGIRKAGIDVPILCMQEQFVENSLGLCVRFIVHADVNNMQACHIYVGKARALRPDLVCEK